MALPGQGNHEEMKAKYKHTNVIAKDWQRLAKFYEEVFGCVRVPPERHLSGEWLAKGTAVKGARFSGVHLALPGYQGQTPTLEIYQYSHNEAKPSPPRQSRGLRPHRLRSRRRGRSIGHRATVRRPHARRSRLPRSPRRRSPDVHLHHRPRRQHPRAPKLEIDRSANDIDFVDESWYPISTLQKEILHIRCREMTKLLEEAFKKASKLPEVEQNALAKWLLEELEDERKWEKEFSESEDVLDRLADEAIEEHGKGKTKPMDFGRL